MILNDRVYVAAVKERPISVQLIAILLLLAGDNRFEIIVLGKG